MGLAFAPLSSPGSAAAQPARCPVSTSTPSKAFDRMGDTRTYELLPGGSFSGAHGWTLEPGARVVTTGEDRGRARDRHRRALELDPGGTAISPPLCVDAGSVTVRALWRASGARVSPIAVRARPVENREGPARMIAAARGPATVAGGPSYRSGRRDAAPTINRAIATVSARGGGLVRLRAGTYRLDAPVRLARNVVLRGEGMGATRLRPRGTMPAGIVASSGDAVTGAGIERLTVDVDGAAANGVQLSGVTDVVVRQVRVLRAGRNGIVVLSDGRPSQDVTVDRSIVRGSGAASPTGEDGFGVRMIGVSRAVIRANLLGGNRGMGIGLAAGVTGSSDALILANRISQAPSTIGYEAIGLTAGCDAAIVQGNDIVDSEDNGISLSGSRSIARGNRIRGTRDHGIASGGSQNLIEGNDIRGVGFADRGRVPERAGIVLGGTDIVVRRNVVASTGPGSTMAYGIKQNQVTGGHQVSDNDVRGFARSKYWFTPGNRAGLSPDSTVVEGPALAPRRALSWRGRWAAGPGGVLPFGAVRWLRIQLTNTGSATMQIDDARLASGDYTEKPQR